MKNPNEVEDEQRVHADTDISLPYSTHISSASTHLTEHGNLMTIKNVCVLQPKPVDMDVYDIAEQMITGVANIKNETKLRLINDRIPETDFEFPARDYKDKHEKDGVKRRYCSRDWLHVHDYLAYSKQADGLFCLCCVMFPVSCLTGQSAKALISEPYRNWNDAKSDLSNHATLQYHQDSKALMNGFIWTASEPENVIENLLSRREGAVNH